MGKKGGSLKTKRAEVPSFWKISKKDKRFVIRTEPGPHPKGYSYPLLVLIRDVLRLAKTNRVATQALNDGKIMVDGKVVRSPRFPVGLMDVIDIPAIGKSFRIVPSRGGLEPVEIPSSEKDLKLCIVTNKSTLRRAKTVCGLHDGRVLSPAAEVEIGLGDSCILKVPGQEFQTSFKLTNGELALLTRGERSGEIVTVEDFKPGTYSRGAIASVRLADGTSSELPSDILMPLGKQAPNLTLSKRSASQ
ncbi:MAG: S4 domain-containing protein [Nitrososphaerales archaeon]